MINRFLRTASPRRLLGTIGGVVVVLAGGAAIAIAAQGSGPVPAHEPLAQAVHQALAARQVRGISADISFTNKLINASELQGTDPLLSGGTGHVWVSDDGRFRLELYGDNGDPGIVVTKTGWWVSDPTMQTVYEGTLPKSGASGDKSPARHALPTVAHIQSELGKLMQHINVSGAAPTDVGGLASYTVSVSPKHSGGLLGEAQLAWDAIRGVPLRFAVYARGDNSNPVVQIAATGISYGPIASSIFDIEPPTGYKVVKVATPATSSSVAKGAAKLRHARRAEVAGVNAVSSKVPFRLAAPAKLVGLPRQSARLLEMRGHNGALVTYGQGLGGIAVIEQSASASSSQKINLTNGSGDQGRGVALPSVSIDGTTGQELDTALGTIVRFTRGGVTFTVLGSVPPYAADAAARAL